MTESSATQPESLAHKRIKRSSGALGLFIKAVIAVAIPTIIAAYYFFFIAADRYVTSTIFSVRSDTANPASMIADAGYSLMNDNAGKDLLVVKEYIESVALLNVLDKQLDLKTIYRHPDADFIKRLPDDITNESFLDYYRQMINIELSQDAGIIRFSAQAFTAEDALSIAELTIETTETFINAMTSRIRQDDLRFAEQQLKDAENRVVGVLEEINTFRKKNNSIDPAQAGSGVLSLISELESEKSKLRAELDATVRVFSNRTSTVQGLKRKISALQREIDKQKGVLVEESGPTPLSDVMQKYQELVTHQEFSLKRYEIALASYEAALVNANRKTKYIVRIVEPAISDAPSLPERADNTLLAFVVSVMGLMIVGLLGASVRDHMVT